MDTPNHVKEEREKFFSYQTIIYLTVRFDIRHKCIMTGSLRITSLLFLQLCSVKCVVSKSTTRYTEYHMDPKRNLIRTLSIACVIAVVLGGAIWYVTTDIDKKFLVIRQIRTEIRSKEHALSALASLQRDAEKANQYLPQVDRMFTTKEQLLSFSTDMNFLAQQAGFSGSPKFKEETAPQKGDLHKANFTLSLEGVKDINDLGKFFALVEKSKYYVKFATIDVTRDGATLRASLGGYVVSF